VDATIMALDSTDPAATPLPLAALAVRQRPLEIALAWVHLPSGGAAVQGIVRHPDGGPIVAGSALRNRPVGARATEVLSPGADPHTIPGQRLRSDHWAIDSPAVAEPLLAERGWQLTSRTDAILILISQGYRMRQSSEPGHVVFLDQGDNAVWHDWTVAGKTFPYVRAAFVTRRLPPLVVVSDTAGGHRVSEST
jgi:hypothetical protein